MTPPTDIQRYRRKILEIELLIAESRLSIPHVEEPAIRDNVKTSLENLMAMHQLFLRVVTFLEKVYSENEGEPAAEPRYPSRVVKRQWYRLASACQDRGVRGGGPYSSCVWPVVWAPQASCHRLSGSTRQTLSFFAFATWFARRMMTGAIRFADLAA